MFLNKENKEKATNNRFTEIVKDMKDLKIAAVYITIAVVSIYILMLAYSLVFGERVASTPGTDTNNSSGVLYPSLDDFSPTSSGAFWNWEKDPFIGKLIYVDGLTQTLGVAVSYPASGEIVRNLSAGTGMECSTFTVIDADGGPIYDSVTSGVSDMSVIFAFLKNGDTLKAYCADPSCGRINKECQILKASDR